MTFLTVTLWSEDICECYHVQICHHKGLGAVKTIFWFLHISADKLKIVPYVLFLLQKLIEFALKFCICFAILDFGRQS